MAGASQERKMRQLAIVSCYLLLAAEVVAQDETTRQGSGTRGYFVAPVIKYTAIRDQGSAMLGFRGGWNIKPPLALGAGLFGTITRVDGPDGAVPDAPGPLDIKLESFGFDVEYAPKPGAPTHLTLNLFFGGGAGHYVQEDTDEQHGETDFLLLLEPAVGVDQRVTDWLHLNLGASYRLVSGVELAGLQNGDFNGPAAALAMKLGL
jgi:hypothetical protein